MRALVLVATVAVSCAIAGCASQQVASMSATPDSDAGYMNVKAGKRQETLVGSRLPRDTRENAEQTKTVSRKAYQEAIIGAPSPTGPVPGNGM